MEHNEQPSDPFSSDGLWRISQFTLQSVQPLEPLPWADGLPDLTGGAFKSPLDLIGEDGSKLQQLDILEADFSDSDEQPESITDASTHSGSDIGIERKIEEEELENIWPLDLLEAGPHIKDSLKSWEKYQDRSYHEPLSAYFSESGAKGFDAALACQTSKRKGSSPRHIARNEPFFKCLIRLGLGWSSLFFRYNEQQAKFERVLDDVRVSGTSLLALNGLTDEILRCGTDMQKIRKFVANTRSNANDLSALSTLSSAMSVILYTLEARVIRSYKTAVSLIRIRSLFCQCSDLVGALADMIESIDGAVSEAKIMSIVLARAAHFSQTFGHMEDLFREIVARVIKPFLAHIEAWVGFRRETSTLTELATSGRSFVAIKPHEENNKAFSKAPRLEYVYRPDQMPSFIPTDQASLIFESGRSLRLLKRFHPQHPITSDDIFTERYSRLDCASTWADIERIQQKARYYERDLRAEILKYNRKRPSEKETLDSVAETSLQDEHNEISSHAFDLFDIDDQERTTGLLTKGCAFERDKIGELLRDRDDGDSPETGYHINIGPELSSSLYLSLSPFLSSQALLVDFSCLHLLFKEHNLRYHLNLQWRFQLLGDGFFASRLSHSLFDPEMESGERKSGVVRSGVHTGLRLGSRDSWPPASSELRLVLIGLLDECSGADDRLSDVESAEYRKERELPGGLSFSIRELKDEEIAKCKDPDAIEALDFLCLQYKPSDVLGTIITQRSLGRYDRLFKHLLRLLRMVSVVKGLIRDSTARNSLSGDPRNVFQRFRVDCQHFILALGDYCFHIGVESTWQRLQDTLSNIEACLEKGDIDGTIEAAHSVPSLRRHHEEVLDQMLFALFLSKRHTEAAKLLESIFGTILTFAPLSRIDGMRGVRHESETTVRRLYALFRKQTAGFVGYLRGLDSARSSSKLFGRSGSAVSPKEASTLVFEQLLARLDVKKYY
ncbi:hypothetical protein FE257_003018 [Aspergillus nanangensis]|uniref:Spindle pole body component n=1 Tax=Aspergillus nanangensis TaxID=2582783 RepID=A0AAD4CC37_ASPNN|nr:hypothetical protein FE257_003018 [Aspergillus nanangensis]